MKTVINDSWVLKPIGHNVHTTGDTLCIQKANNIHRTSFPRKRLQWNLRTRDTLGLIVLSLVERLSLSRRYVYTLKIISTVLQQVPFVERLSLSQRVPYQRFHGKLVCIDTQYICYSANGWIITVNNYYRGV